MEGLLASLLTALFEAFGEAAVRSACDAECHRRKRLDERAAVNAEAEAAFGPIPDAESPLPASYVGGSDGKSGPSEQH